MTAIEVCPGVFVSQDGSARGPGLEAALALAADFATLNAWAARDPGCRVWFMRPHPAGACECVLSDNRHEPDGTDRSTFSWARYRAMTRWEHSIEGSWLAAFGSHTARDNNQAALRKATDAIRNGRI